MPVHRIVSGPADNDAEALTDGIKKIEAKGEDVVQVLSLTAFPTGEWVIVTRKTRARLETRKQS